MNVFTLRSSTSLSHGKRTPLARPAYKGPVRASSNPPNNHLSSPFAWTPSGQNRNHHGVTMVVRAAAEATEQAKTTEFQFGLAGGRRIDVAVTQCDDGAQEISFWSDVPGRLILHWGVVGGPNYQGGWRLPPESLWPEGTVNYKKRALQTPWVELGDDQSRVIIRLPSHERSDELNFVLKELTSSTWYDFNGGNFAVPLKPQPHVAVRTRSPSPRPVSPASESNRVATFQQLPQQLCGIWAYIKWEFNGSPTRSQEESDAEYKKGIEEMKALLAFGGKTIDWLEQVGRGQIRYKDIQGEIADALARMNGPSYDAHGNGNGNGATATAPVSRPAPPPAAPSAVPQDLINVKAYLLWEDNGRPPGADFGPQARQMLEQELANGASLAQIEAKLKAPPPPRSKTPAARAPAAPAAPPPAPAAPPPPAKTEIGAPSGTKLRDPMSLIRKPGSGSGSGAPALLSEINRKVVSPLKPLLDLAGADSATKWKRMFNLGNKTSCLVVVSQWRDDQPVEVTITTDNPNEIVLHYGLLAEGQKKWTLPPKDCRPADTEEATSSACETPLSECTQEECLLEIGGQKVPLQRVTLSIPATRVSEFSGLSFVLRSADQSVWWKDSDRDFRVPLPSGSESTDTSRASLMALKSLDEISAALANDELASIIVDCEVKSNAWTLMHRCNKAAELINDIVNGTYKGDVVDHCVKIFVWLRYSGLRQLTWQRNYNTQPRILSGAQKRLTDTLQHAMSALAGPHPEASEWLRASLGFCGRGGDGQKIRDEILNIMHRNHIKEVKGTWMEEWHQKLHNNTTPDDIGICVAYLRFLESRGDLGAYWSALQDHGITKERLASFDRAITTLPEYYADKRDRLIAEFYNYLGILKNVHSGADLSTSLTNCQHMLSGNTKGLVGYILAHLNDPQVLPLVEACVEARAQIQPLIYQNVEICFLDLALEQVVRQAAERAAGAQGNASALLGPLLQNLILSYHDNEELCYCLKAWLELPQGALSGRPSKDEAMRAMAALDRIRRALAAVSDQTGLRVGPWSQRLGTAFNCEKWSVDLFSEEVVRGGPAFAVSLLLSAVEPVFRKASDLSPWQVISPQNVVGIVEIVDSLHKVQDKTYDRPTILLCKRVTGEEEIPEGAVAVLTSDAPDVLSHVSVRARNMKALFATCFEDVPLEELNKMAGKTLAIHVTAAGDVKWNEADAADTGAGALLTGSGSGNGYANLFASGGARSMPIPTWCGKFAVPMTAYPEYTKAIGAKSRNLGLLRERLGSLQGFTTPASVTIPLGTFEKVLEDPANRKIKAELEKTVALVPSNPEQHLAKCRELAASVTIPEALRAELTAAMESMDMPLPKGPERWEKAFTALKAVWASKYNDRAYVSCRKVGLRMDDVRMAVLVQAIVPARYAFVIHTANPTNDNADEVYCELVKGLGETLVSGMYAGRSLAFKASKRQLDAPEVLSYPSKAMGLFVDAADCLIFRSDSNGEDLEGYAGAGLYESVTMDAAEERRCDYEGDEILRDEGKRRELMRRVCRAGVDVEGAWDGMHQDIEGVIGQDGKMVLVQTRPQA